MDGADFVFSETGCFQNGFNRTVGMSVLVTFTGLESKRRRERLGNVVVLVLGGLVACRVLRIHP